LELDPTQLEIVRRNALFGGLSAESLRLLLADTSCTTMRQGKLIFSQGDEVTHFYLVLSGWIKLFRLQPDGTETVLEIFGPGESFAEAALQMPDGYPLNAEMISAGELLEFSASAFLEKLRHQPDIGISMLAALSSKMKSFVRRIERSQKQTAAQKVAEFLLRFGPPPLDLSEATAIALPYDKQLIAARLGIKPETFSRCLIKLRDHGVTVRGSVAHIDDLNGLRRFVAHD